MTTPRLAGLLSAALLGLAIGVAHAQDKKLVLRVADSFPPGHAIPDYATKWWMDAVTKATQGAVEFEYYPAEQLGKAKDLLALTQSGVADIAYVGPSYVSDKMPLSAVSQLPGMFTSACVSVRRRTGNSPRTACSVLRSLCPMGSGRCSPLSRPPTRYSRPSAARMC